MIRNSIEFAAECGMPVLTEDMVKLARFAARMHDHGVARGIDSASILWGFFHNPCIHESASALMSLHRSKAGAYRAMNRAQWLAWEEQRDHRCRDGWPKGILVTDYERWRIAPVMPQP